MLGMLFNLGSGSAPDAPDASQGNTAKPVSSMESVHEDMHTRNLLFPDPQTLFQQRNDNLFPLSATPLPLAASPSSFDYSNDVDLETRDVRILVMQDTLGPVNTALLYDSNPAPSPSVFDRPPISGPSHDPRRTPTSPRQSSLGQPSSRPLVIQPDSPQPRQGAFDRRSSMHGRNQIYGETEMQRTSREYREELGVFSSCVFGTSELMAYKGTSTKVHVVPSDARSSDYQSSIITDGRGSIGRASMRSSKFAQSFSSEIVSPIHAGPSSFMTSHSISRPSDRKKVLITRLFPVVLPNDDRASPTVAEAVGQPPFESLTGRPTPQQAQDDLSQTRKRKLHLKQKRTPMYAVVLVIQLPTNPVSSSQRQSFRSPSSFTEGDSFPSSYNSSRRSGFTMGGGLFPDSLDSSMSVDADDRIDYLTQHWDIIMRTLTHLQSVVATTISSMLKQVDLSSADPYYPPVPIRTPSLSNRRGEDYYVPKPNKSNAKHVVLPPNSLANDDHIAKEIETARSRIVTGLRASRVVTGQGRWPMWRDEARLVVRWLGSAEEHFFFYNLLNGFLAIHTDWLQALCPPHYRSRYLRQQKTRAEEDLSVPSRTIIVSPDKMVARRLVFLLSAFLPADQQLPYARTHRPSTSLSHSALSQSPPSFVVPILKEESLRRKINRRTTPGTRRVSHSRNASQSTRASGVPVQLAHLSMEGHHERRGSDAASIRTMNFAAPYGENVVRKSSAAVTATTDQDTTVPHFSTLHRAESRRTNRPGSSSSVAADDLRRSLQRVDSLGQGSVSSVESRNQGLRWGSVISGLWTGARRRGSMASSSSKGLPSPGLREMPPRATQGRVNVAGITDRPPSDSAVETGEVGVYPGKLAEGPQTPRGLQVESRELSPEPETRPQRIIDPTSAFESPVKTSINIEDGVIDVDIPFPDYLTSFDTAVSSPSSSGYLSTPGLGAGLDSFESFRITVDSDFPMNTAGYLNRFHPDFALQAVPPQPELESQVKASLKAEPSPSSALNFSSEEAVERWVDVSSAIIADLTTCTVKRIRYRRLIHPKQAPDRHAAPGMGGANPYGALVTPLVLPYETLIQEEFEDEEITGFDDIITEAVERVVAQTGDLSKHSSSNSSRSNSKPRRRDSTVSLPGASTGASTGVSAEVSTHRPRTMVEVPRGECKTLILSALKNTIQDVIDTRDGHSSARQAAGDSFLRTGIREWLDIIDGPEPNVT